MAGVPELQAVFAQLTRLTESSADEGLSTKEIQKALGVCPDKARVVIRMALDAGLCKCVGSKWINCISGYRRRIPTYAFSMPKKVKKKK